MTLNNTDSTAAYNKNDLEYVVKLLSDRINSVSNSSTIRIDFPSNPNTDIPMWLVTDKDGSTKIIMCSDKPVKSESASTWAPGNGDYQQAYIDSPFAAKFFGIFWKKAAEELRKMGLPKWEDDPIEIEVSRIKINYY